MENFLKNNVARNELSVLLCLFSNSETGKNPHMERVYNEFT